MVGAVEALSVAYYITQQTIYASKAQELLSVWFIDKETKMNPNMNYAQYIPGINTGRGIGIIETHDIYKILDAIILLRTSMLWKQEMDQAMVKWFDDYHGSWYDVQVSALGLFLGKKDAATKILEEVKKKRIDVQIDNDGKQPLELARTKSWRYSNYNLMALMHLALLGEHVRIDLWNYQSASGGSIHKALNYLLPFGKDPQKWQYTQIEEMKNADLFLNLHMAKQKYNLKQNPAWIDMTPDQGFFVGFLDSLI
jgi:hypothetical protein